MADILSTCPNQIEIFRSLGCTKQVEGVEVVDMERMKEMRECSERVSAMLASVE